MEPLEQQYENTSVPDVRASARKMVRTAKRAGLDLPFSAAMRNAKKVASDEIWMNDVVQVNVDRDGFAPWVHLSHKRRGTKDPVRVWRDSLQMKDQIVGREQEGLELFPASSRLVDTSNQFHLWISLGQHQIPFGVGLDLERPNVWRMNGSSFDPDAEPDEVIEISGLRVSVREFVADTGKIGARASSPFCQIVVHAAEPVTDWRFLQFVKDGIVGETCEAIELYPARARTDFDGTESILWGCRDPEIMFPVGYASGRMVVDGDGFRDDGSKQRKIGDFGTPRG